MNTPELKERTKTFALRVMRMSRSIPSGRIENVIANQIIRCGTSVAANYRAVCLGRSKKDFISKLGIVAEEADETALWLELLIEDNIMPTEKLTPLHTESCELTAIFLASIKTARSN